MHEALGISLNLTVTPLFVVTLVYHIDQLPRGSFTYRAIIILLCTCVVTFLETVALSNIQGLDL